MNKFIEFCAGLVAITLLLLAGLLGVSMSSANAAPVAGKVQFNYIKFDSPGTDSGTNASLNGEYVRFINGTKATVDTTGWTLSDKSGHKLVLGKMILAPGQFAVVKSGKGTKTARQQYWGQSWYVWNNTGDTAVLRNKAGSTLDACAWSSLGKGYIYC